MRPTRLCVPVVVLLIGLAGCGGGDSSSTTETTQAEAGAALKGPKPPKDASPLERQIYRNFQSPKADPEVKGSAKAIAAGEAACRGKTPAQVKNEFISQSELSANQRQALSQIDRAEAKPSADYAAGQLAGLVYEGTLEGTAAEYGYRGCVFALARGLEGRLGG
jgi:hypothetical protein